MSVASMLMGGRPAKTAKSENAGKSKLVPWVEKYRPKSLNDVTAQDHTITVLRKSLESTNLPHMLFYGPPGTGKTSTILALCRELFGPELMKSRVLELNASDERGISIVREKIKNFARIAVSTPSAESLKEYPCPPFKIIILDEADSMTSDAQSALRRTMETYSSITRFCLICNYVTRIIDPLASRCSKFRFKPLDESNSLDRLKLVASSENVNMEEGALESILQIAGGDLRKAITILQSAARLHLHKGTSEQYDDDGDLIVGDDNDADNADAVVTKESVAEISGYIPERIIESLLAACRAPSYSQAVEQLIKEVENVMYDGWSAVQLISQVHDSLVMDDSLSAGQKNQIALALLETDKRLSDGTDEHIQVLNAMVKIAKAMV